MCCPVAHGRGLLRVLVPVLASVAHVGPPLRHGVDVPEFPQVPHRTAGGVPSYAPSLDQRGLRRVESVPGPWGGYRLGPGTRTPPLALDDEEALAVAVALREAALSGVLGTGQAALSALLKLRQGLPTRLADQLGTTDGALEHTPRSGEPQIDALLLLELARACHSALRTTLSYRDHAGRASVRAVDPYRLVHTGLRWYLVARDVAKQEWRTFRADRVVGVRSTAEPVDLTDPPDAAALVSRGIASVVYPVYATFRLPLPLDTPCGKSRPPSVRTALTAPKPPWSGSAATAPTSSPPTSSVWPHRSRCCPRTRCAGHSSATPTPSWQPIADRDGHRGGGASRSPGPAAGVGCPSGAASRHRAQRQSLGSVLANSDALVTFWSQSRTVRSGRSGDR